jgi:hypothetical protein
MESRTENWPFTGGVALTESAGDEKTPTRIVYERNEKAVTLVVGTTKLYDHGKLRLIPVLDLENLEALTH